MPCRAATLAHLGNDVLHLAGEAAPHLLEQLKPGPTHPPAINTAPTVTRPSSRDTSPVAPVLHFIAHSEHLGGDPTHRLETSTLAGSAYPSPRRGCLLHTDAKYACVSAGARGSDSDTDARPAVRLHKDARVPLLLLRQQRRAGSGAWLLPRQHAAFSQKSLAP